MRLPRRSFLGLALATTALAATPLRADNPVLQVVATTGMIADAARQVGGDLVAVKALMGPGVDPHAYRQTRTDIVAMTRADLVLWHPAFFGVKPEMVLMGGSIVCAQMGDPNASIPTPQPVYTRLMFGAFGRSLEASAVTFVSEAAMAEDVGKRLGLAKVTLPVKNTRSIGKKDLVLNDATPEVDVHPETYEVCADGELLTCQPAEVLPMAQRYFLF